MKSDDTTDLSDEDRSLAMARISAARAQTSAKDTIAALKPGVEALLRSRIREVPAEDGKTIEVLVPIRLDGATLQMERKTDYDYSAGITLLAAELARMMAMEKTGVKKNAPATPPVIIENGATDSVILIAPPGWLADHGFTPQPQWPVKKTGAQATAQITWNAAVRDSKPPTKEPARSAAAEGPRGLRRMFARLFGLARGRGE